MRGRRVLCWQPWTTPVTVRVRQGRRLITDGPFVETKEWPGTGPTSDPGNGARSVTLLLLGILTPVSEGSHGENVIIADGGSIPVGATRFY